MKIPLLNCSTWGQTITSPNHFAAKFYKRVSKVKLKRTAYRVGFLKMKRFWNWECSPAGWPIKLEMGWDSWLKRENASDTPLLFDDLGRPKAAFAAVTDALRRS